MEDSLFRVWDNRNHKMIYDVIVSGSMLLLPVYHMKGAFMGIDGREYVQVSKCVYPVMPNSFLPDINGHILYAGDIVADVRGFHIKGIVTYNKRKACFTIDFGKGEQPLYEALKDRPLELIGDIYTSEKLLVEWGFAEPLPL